jgi:hypothetical protein
LSFEEKTSRKVPPQNLIVESDEALKITCTIGSVYQELRSWNRIPGKGSDKRMMSMRKAEITSLLMLEVDADA